MSSLPAPIAHQQAQQLLLDMARPLAAKTMAPAEAVGRYLAQPLVAQRTQPPADLSAMDGYAMRADDLCGPWKVVGESAAGHPFADTLTAGEAIRISTGALMPLAGGAVLLQENAQRDGNTLSLSSKDGPTPRHIRRTGLDFEAGDQLLETGTKITPARVALALAAGHASLQIGALPSIAVLDSGDELASDPTNLAPHQIPASNGAMLQALTAPLVSHCKRLGPVGDTMQAMGDALDRAGDVDVLVTSGGASVGDHDLVRPALEEWGAQLAFWRIAMKPGKPLMVARRGSQLVIGLPGNPVSSYITAFLFLLPVLRFLAGASQPLPMALGAPLLSPLPATHHRAEFVRAQLSAQGVSLLGQQDSSALASLSAANCLIERPANAAPAEPGSMAKIYLLQNGGMA